MQRLDGKWALVTGSSRGIGQQIALGLAQRGCKVVVHGREIANVESTRTLLRETGVETFAVAGELGQPTSVDAIIQAVKEGPGHVDILYNNAAIQNPWREIYDITREEWLATFETNLFAVIALCHAFAPEMKRRGYGRIINLSSGIRGIPQLAPYSVTKAAIDKYTSDLAADLQGTNVLVNGLDPGWLRTDMGGQGAMFGVETVLPGALVPALLEDNGPSGRVYSAQDFKCLG
jgi:NAD(P)-dependent dehydrogenase (short-subunit alcohol dehydrogenase family)